MADLLTIAVCVAACLATAQCARQFWLAISLPVLAESALVAPATSAGVDDSLCLRRMVAAGAWLSIAFGSATLAYLLQGVG